MAFTTTVNNKSGGTSDSYNIDWSVGKIGVNRREDVMLVQALFKIYYYQLLGFNGGNDPPAGETAVIEVDGIPGPATRRHIVHFQSQMLKRGSNVMLDGNFDPFRNQGQLSTVSKTRYALELLNNGCHLHCKEQGVDYYSNLPNRHDMPLLLRSALQTHKTMADKYRQGWGGSDLAVPETGGY